MTSKLIRLEKKNYGLKCNEDGTFLKIDVKIEGTLSEDFLTELLEKDNLIVTYNENGTLNSIEFCDVQFDSDKG